MLTQIALFFVTAVAVIGGLPTTDYRLRTTDYGLQIAAPSAFLIDIDTGDILFAKEADKERPIASITKLMTAVALLDNKPDWDKVIQFKARDQRNGDVDYLIPGEEITVKDGWNLMLVASSNDATALLVRTIFGNEDNCVSAMNAKKAYEIGLRRTMFTDPTGLSPENVSTAREIAALARFALSFPEIKRAAQQSSFIFTPKGKSERVAKSTNQMLSWFRSPGMAVFGGKTGHIEESGYNLVFAVGNKKHELVSVILGSESNESRLSEMYRLLRWGLKATAP